MIKTRDRKFRGGFFFVLRTSDSGVDAVRKVRLVEVGLDLEPDIIGILPLGHIA